MIVICNRPVSNEDIESVDPYYDRPIEPDLSALLAIVILFVFIFPVVWVWRAVR